MKLRPYQRATLEAIVEAMAGGHNRLLVKKPTGTGKTVTFAALPQWPDIKGWLETFPADERKMLVIAHREELLEQAAAKIHAANPHARVNIEQGDRYASPFADVVVASIQTLAAVRFRRLRRLLSRHRFRLVIVDEAHHAAASTYRTALTMLGFLPRGDASTEENIDVAEFSDVAAMRAALEGWDEQAPRDRLLVGVTATPNRSDAIGLGCVFQTIAYSYDLRQAIKDNWLVPIVPWVVETGTSLDHVKTNRGEFNQRELAEAVNEERRNKLAVAAWHEYGHGRPTLAFTVDVAHAHALAAEFNEQQVNAEALSGETPKDVRRQMLQAFRDRRIDVITNCMVLTEGTDLPMASCILHAKPTKSSTLYEQMTGRGLRLDEGKSDCVVIDIVDVARRHSLQTAPVLYGLPPDLEALGEELERLAVDYEAIVEKYPGITLDGRMTLAELQAKASTFDVWQIPDMGELGAGRTLSWIRTGETSFRLSFPWGEGFEVLTVEPNLLEQFEIRSVYTPKDRTVPKAAQTVATGLATPEAALSLAESYVAQSRPSAARMADPDAPWRGKEPSAGQLKYLARLKVPIRPGLTRGEASQLIELAKSKGGR